MECLPEGLDGALLLAPVHRRYYLDIVSSAGTLLVTRSKCIFIVDFRYIVMARGHIRGAEVLLQDNLEEQLEQLIADENLKCIGTDVRQSADGNQIMFLNLVVVRLVYKGHRKHSLLLQIRFVDAGETLR